MAIRFLQTSDWHLGKNMNGRVLIEDQAEVLNQIKKQLQKGVEENNPYAALLVPGDVYDRSIPPEEATILLSDFLSDIKDSFPSLHLFISAGNHDSASRLSFAASIFKKQNIHLAGSTADFSKPVIITASSDGSEEKAAIYQLPYLYPRSIKNQKEDTYLYRQQELYEEACRQIQEVHQKKYKDLPSVLCAHLFTLGAVKGGSERSNVGDAEQVSSEVFKDFTYGAFGHIHGYHVCDSQGRCYYSGAPLAYHVDDNPETFMLDVVLNGKEIPVVNKIPFKPLHPVVKLENTIGELTNGSSEWLKYKNHYVYVSLTDKVSVPNAHELLRPVFPFLISAQPKERTFGGKAASIEERRIAVESKDINKIFEQFLKEVSGTNQEDEELLNQEKEILKQLAEEIRWGENL